MAFLLLVVLFEIIPLEPQLLQQCLQQLNARFWQQYSFTSKNFLHNCDRKANNQPPSNNQNKNEGSSAHQLQPHYKCSNCSPACISQRTVCVILFRGCCYIRDGSHFQLAAQHKQLRFAHIQIDITVTVKRTKMAVEAPIKQEQLHRAASQRTTIESAGNRTISFVPLRQEPKPQITLYALMLCKLLAQFVSDYLLTGGQDNEKQDRQDQEYKKILLLFLLFQRETFKSLLRSFGCTFGKSTNCKWPANDSSSGSVVYPDCSGDGGGIYHQQQPTHYEALALHKTKETQQQQQLRLYRRCQVNEMLTILSTALPQWKLNSKDNANFCCSCSCDNCSYNIGMNQQNDAKNTGTMFCSQCCAAYSYYCCCCCCCYYWYWCCWSAVPSARCNNAYAYHQHSDQNAQRQYQSCNKSDRKSYNYNLPNNQQSSSFCCCCCESAFSQRCHPCPASHCYYCCCCLCYLCSHYCNNSQKHSKKKQSSRRAKTTVRENPNIKLKWQQQPQPKHTQMELAQLDAYNFNSFPNKHLKFQYNDEYGEQAGLRFCNGVLKVVRLLPLFNQPPKSNRATERLCNNLPSASKDVVCPVQRTSIVEVPICVVESVIGGRDPVGVKTHRTLFSTVCIFYQKHFVTVLCLTIWLQIKGGKQQQISGRAINASKAASCCRHSVAAPYCVANNDQQLKTNNLCKIFCSNRKRYRRRRRRRRRRRINKQEQQQQQTLQLQQLWLIDFNRICGYLLRQVDSAYCCGNTDHFRLHSPSSSNKKYENIRKRKREEESRTKSQTAIRQQQLEAAARRSATTKFLNQGKCTSLIILKAFKTITNKCTIVLSKPTKASSSNKQMPAALPPAAEGLATSTHAATTTTAAATTTVRIYKRRTNPNLLWLFIGLVWFEGPKLINCSILYNNSNQTFFHNANNSSSTSTNTNSTTANNNTKINTNTNYYQKHAPQVSQSQPHQKQQRHQAESQLQRQPIALNYSAVDLSKSEMPAAKSYNFINSEVAVMRAANNSDFMKTNWNELLVDSQKVSKQLRHINYYTNMTYHQQQQPQQRRVERSPGIADKHNATAHNYESDLAEEEIATSTLLWYDAAYAREEQESNRQNDLARLEAIKRQILDKLGLKRKPSVAYPLPKQYIWDTIYRADGLDSIQDFNKFPIHAYKQPQQYLRQQKKLVMARTAKLIKYLANVNRYKKFEEIYNKKKKNNDYAKPLAVSNQENNHIFNSYNYLKLEQQRQRPSSTQQREKLNSQTIQTKLTKQQPAYRNNIIGRKLTYLMDLYKEIKPIEHKSYNKLNAYSSPKSPQVSEQYKSLHNAQPGNGQREQHQKDLQGHYNLDGFEQPNPIDADMPAEYGDSISYDHHSHATVPQKQHAHESYSASKQERKRTGDEYFGHTQEIITFAEKGRMYDHHRSVEFTAHQQNHMQTHRLQIRFAEIHIRLDRIPVASGFKKQERILKSNQSKKEKPKIWVFRITGNNYTQKGFDEISDLCASHSIDTSQLGWQRIDLTETVREWYSTISEVGEKLRLLIDCTGCGQQYVLHLLESSDNEFEPRSEPTAKTMNISMTGIDKQLMVQQQHIEQQLTNNTYRFWQTVQLQNDMQHQQKYKNNATSKKPGLRKLKTSSNCCNQKTKRAQVPMRKQAEAQTVLRSKHLSAVRKSTDPYSPSPHIVGLKLDAEIMPYRPFLVLHTEIKPVRRIRRRAVDCSGALNGQCCKESFYVSFKALGWDDWIIAPRGYFANYCRGDCTGPYRTPDTFQTFHAHFIEEYRKMGLLNGMQPCCAPVKFSSMSLIYYGDDGIIKRDLPKMVVDECGCP